MDLDSFLVSLYVLVDDWWTENRSSVPSKPGRPALLSQSEVLTLAILAQWPRFRSERDFWRFAHSHLRPYFPNLVSQSQLNRRIRALEPELRALQGELAATLSEPSEAYRVMDTTLIPAIVRARVRARARRGGLFADQASFGRCRSKTEWVYGFKVALVVSAEGVVTAFFLAPANSDERPIGEALIVRDHHDAYLWPTRGSPRWHGSGDACKSTTHWWRRRPKRTLAGRGRKRRVGGRRTNGRS
jgi:hypothetical protein